MSDELINLEDDGPEIPAPEAEVQPEAPVEAAVEDAPAEVEAVEVAGKKYVPIGAVIAERKQRQTLQAKADRADQLEAYVNESRPYVEFLKNNPDLLRPRQAVAPAAPTGEAVDPEAEEMAKLLDLYTPDGQPDLKRASKFLKVVDVKSERRVQAGMAPVHERNFQEQSARNFQLASQYKDPQGRSPDPKALLHVWKTVSAEQSANPDVASILTLTALGAGYATSKPQPAAPGTPPVVTEGAGGGPRRASLSDIEQKIAKDRGVSHAAWAEDTKTFVKGRANQLED